MQNQIVTKKHVFVKLHIHVYISMPCTTVQCSIFNHLTKYDQIVKFNQPENEPIRNSIIQSKLYLMMGSFPKKFPVDHLPFFLSVLNETSPLRKDRLFSKGTCRVEARQKNVHLYAGHSSHHPGADSGLGTFEASDASLLDQ